MVGNPAKVVIDGHAIETTDNATILEAARAAGIAIPTLCHFADLNDIGACRVCVVEVEGEDRLAASCNTCVQDGMVVRTDTDAVREARTVALQLLLSHHDLNCAYCKRNGTCRFQTLLLDAGLVEWDPTGTFMTEAPSAYPRHLEKGRRAAWPAQAIIQRDENRCVKCGRCIAWRTSACGISSGRDRARP